MLYKDITDYERIRSVQGRSVLGFNVAWHLLCLILGSLAGDWQSKIKNFCCDLTFVIDETRVRLVDCCSRLKLL